MSNADRPAPRRTNREYVHAVLRSMDEHPEKWKLNPYSETIAAGTTHTYADWVVWGGGIVSYIFGMCQIKEPIEVHFTLREWWAVRKRMRRMRDKAERVIPLVPGEIEDLEKLYDR